MARDLPLSPAFASPTRGFRAAAGTVVAIAGRWLHRRRTRAHLGALPPHLLRDIGLNEAAAEAEARKPFWRA